MATLRSIRSTSGITELERGLQGLLTGVKGVTIAARGAELGAFAEHQGAYMSTWYEMVGIKEHYDIAVEKTLYGSEVDAQSRAAGRDAAVELAKRLEV